MPLLENNFSGVSQWSLSERLNVSHFRENLSSITKTHHNIFNQYYSTVVHLLIIYIAIFCHGTSLKKTSGHVGTRTCVAGISSQQTCYPLDHHAYPKKDASIQELSKTVFSHSSNVRNNIGRMGKDSVSWLDASFFEDAWWSKR